MTDPSAHWAFWVLIPPAIIAAAIFVFRWHGREYAIREAEALRQIRTGTNHRD